MEAEPNSSRPGRSTSAAPSPPSTAPEWFQDEVPTQRPTETLIAAPDVALSPDRPLLKVLVGRNAGQVFTLDRDETVIGRGREVHVHLDEAGISRKHARIVRAEGGRYVLEDLDSTNGIHIDGRRVALADLADGDRVQIGSNLVLRFVLVAADEEALARRLYEGSTRDALTRAFNRKYVTEMLAADVNYAHRHGTCLGVVMFDLDHFKGVNDTFGHQAGDIVLRVVAGQAEKSIRNEDVLARYGGEEFVVLVRGVEPKGVRALAERIRRNVERLSIPWQSRTIKTTVSIGVATLAECEAKATGEILVAQADKRLYEAKAGGRNRVCS
jgi:two-component system cell cycle response regulator